MFYIFSKIIFIKIIIKNEKQVPNLQVAKGVGRATSISAQHPIWLHVFRCSYLILLFLKWMAATKNLTTFPKALLDEVEKWGGRKQTGVSLGYMTKFGSQPTPRNFLFSARFLHKELPIRIARRTLELQNLPFGLSHKPAVLKVLLYSPFSFVASSTPIS